MSQRNFEDASCEICCDPGTMEEQVQPQNYTSAVSATEQTIGYALKVWAAIQMINGLAS